MGYTKTASGMPGSGFGRLGRTTDLHTGRAGVEEGTGSRGFRTAYDQYGNIIGGNGYNGGYGSYGNMPYDPYLEAMTKASKTTQARAAKDREAALSELKGTRESALQEFADVPEDVINEDIASKMYAGQRDIIEGQKSANLRNIQRSFYGGGSAPSGAMLEASMSAERGATGQMSKAKSDIDVQRALKNWESRFGLAREKAGIRTDIAPEMVDVYGNTIAEVPEVGGVKDNAANIMASNTTNTTNSRTPSQVGISRNALRLPPDANKKKQLITGATKY